MQPRYDYLKQPSSNNHPMLTGSFRWNIAMSFKRASWSFWSKAAFQCVTAADYLLLLLYHCFLEEQYFNWDFHQCHSAPKIWQYWDRLWKTMVNFLLLGYDSVCLIWIKQAVICNNTLITICFSAIGILLELQLQQWILWARDYLCSGRRGRCMLVSLHFNNINASQATDDTSKM